MHLSDIQNAFQSALLTGDDAILAVLPDGAREPRDVLLGVYRDAYVLRLVEVLHNDHELLHAYLGDEAFDAMARAYIASHPSRTRNARWFGAHLPAFLSATTPYREHRHIAELAALEKALNDAFDAADTPVVTVADVTSIPPEEWSRLMLKPHPSCERLDLASNALAIWSALSRGDAPPAPQPLDQPQAVIVWRGPANPMVRAMGAEEAMLWDEAARGGPFGVLCEMAATYDAPETAAWRAASCLLGWLNAGMLGAASVGGE
jgi:hypothetical protein